MTDRWAMRGHSASQAGCPIPLAQRDADDAEPTIGAERSRERPHTDHRRGRHAPAPRLLAESLDALAAQSRPLDHLIVVDNDNDARVAELVARPADPDHLSGLTPKPRRRRRFRARACCMRWRWAPIGCGWPTTTAGPPIPKCWRRCWRARAEHSAGRGVADGVRHDRSARSGVPVAPWAGVAAAGQRTQY